ncbi:BgTH12-03235 [Blumeria graminis f. sp. triticale]|uniref:BgtA-21309 n=3 Tax=Blumeria graminis TaxID=34373 RepID=A0A9X9QDY8_BLUGR|nr:hypothetical protein BGT96224_A21309 [Blumeria graminis f. sp. tritici 96224]CAD6503575.1 BgTH12-03235 [Blumeria graminis f. sp. triticale]VDB89717.1 BgtA-21309 [Blumeria graminis f. sp. tritici]
MTTPSKQASRWGSLLQQAVAGVESRLDNILAEGTDDISSPQATKNPISSPSRTLPKPEVSTPRKVRNVNKANDRLQERLARAVSSQNITPKDKLLSLALTSERNGSSKIEESPRTSIDSIPNNPLENDSDVEATRTAKLEEESSDKYLSIQLDSLTPEGVGPHGIKTEKDVTSSKIGDNQGEISFDLTRPSSLRLSVDSTTPKIFPPMKTKVDSAINSSALSENEANSEKNEANSEKNESHNLVAESQRQEEINNYIEKIDALQTKLQYLVKESAENAKLNGAVASTDSLEKKLADKELQVALLMEEGHNLSKKELNYLATIKKLRAKIQVDSKELLANTKKLEHAESTALIASEQLKKAQIFENQVNEKNRTIVQLQQEASQFRSEIQTNRNNILDLKTRLDDAISREKVIDSQRIHESLEIEKKRVALLTEEVKKLETEKRSISEKAQSQLKEITEKMEKNSECARATTLEMKNEQRILESKLETMRARAEEVSSGAAGDAQAKLLRQIETLQTQYSVASENWRGIEASLITRALNLEKERDEAARREVDIRRKARDAGLKAKSFEEEADDLRTAVSIAQQKLSETELELNTLRKRAEDAESSLQRLQKDFDAEKSAWKQETQHRLEEEKQKWLETISNSNTTPRNRVTTSLISTKSQIQEHIFSQNAQSQRNSLRSIMYEPISTLNMSNRRSSGQVFQRSSGMFRQDSTTSLKEEMENNVSPIDHEDYLENDNLSSPHFQSAVDLTSISTAGAGPSVQLVERMSSAVRRLECEKAATKEDLARLSIQRDEARAEIIKLMREVENKREIESKLLMLEKEMNEVKERYETTLIMLGEKSEEVDELRGDIADIKTMYRELVERTIK